MPRREFSTNRGSLPSAGPLAGEWQFHVDHIKTVVNWNARIITRTIDPRTWPCGQRHEGSDLKDLG
jgi:hypothetical protein